MNLISYVWAPSDLRSGKALQIYIDLRPYLIITSSHTKHVDAFAHVLTEQCIPFVSQYLHGSNPSPAPKGDRYELAGAGWAKLSPAEIILDSHSDSYRMHSCEKHATEITALLGNRIIRVEKPRPVETPSPPLVKRVCSSEENCPF